MIDPLPALIRATKNLKDDINARLTIEFKVESDPFRIRGTTEDIASAFRKAAGQLQKRIEHEEAVWISEINFWQIINRESMTFGDDATLKALCYKPRSKSALAEQVPTASKSQRGAVGVITR